MVPTDVDFTVLRLCLRRENARAHLFVRIPSANDTRMRFVRSGRRPAQKRLPSGGGGLESGA